MSDSIRVLCVDDDAAFLDVAVSFIERNGMEVMAETSARDALERFDDTVDCIVSDYQMSGMDGLTFLDAIRDRHPDVPFILFTGKGSEEIASEAISAGVTEYIQKEDNVDQYEVLANRIENAVAKRRAERDLERAESRYRRLVEQTLVGIYIVQDDHIQYANPKFAAIFGYEVAEIVGISPFELVAERDHDLLADARRSRNRGSLDESQYVLTGVRKDGTEIDIEVHGGPIEYEDEPAVLGMIRDITERRRREYALRALHDATGDLMRSHTPESVVDITAAAAEDVLGFTVATVRLYDPETDALEPVGVTDAASELLGERPPFDRGTALPWRAFTANEPVLADGSVADYGARDLPLRSTMYVPIDGRGTLSIGSSSERFEDADVRLAQVLAANAGASLDRVERETKLERYGTIVETVDDAVYTVDEEGRFSFVNGAFSTLTGYDREQLLGADVSLLKDDATVERFEDAVRGLLRGETDRTAIEFDLLTADGERVPCEDHLTLLPHEGSYRGCAGVIRDLTEYKRREAALERQNERLEEFASVVSHDLRNPLGVARGRLELAHSECPTSHHEDVRWALSRMDSLITDILALARQGNVVDETAPVALEPVAEAAWTSVENGMATLVLGDLGTMEADADRLQRLFENLFRNAIEHVGPDVTVRVESLADGGFHVADDGPGIPTSERERVFEGGYTTGEGTGLGLAIVRSIAEAHGWHVSIVDDDGARIEVHT